MNDSALSKRQHPTTPNVTLPKEKENGHKKSPQAAFELRDLQTSFSAVRTGLTESLINTDIQSIIIIIQEKHPSLHLLHFYVFPIGICLVPTG